MAESKYINLLTDYGFKRVFGNEEVMTAFLNDILRPKSKICNVTFLNKEMYPFNRYERGVIYDLRCRLEDGSEIIVEMQKGEQEYFADRILYYLSRSISYQGDKGKKPSPENKDVKIDWDFKLKPVYGIFFMNFSIGNLEPSPLREIGFYIKGTNTLFCDKIRAYTIELPEYRKNKVSDCKEELDYWTYIINNMDHLTTIPFTKEMPVFDKIGNLASIASMTPDEYTLYQDSIDAYRTTLSSYEYYEKKGMEEGKRKGAIATAIALKAMGKLTTKEISDATGLTIEEIEAL